MTRLQLGAGRPGTPPAARTAAPAPKPASRPAELAAFALATAFALAAVLNLNVPYFAVAPGPTQNVVHLISIDGPEPSEVSGDILLTTVSLRSIRLWEAVRSWLDPAIEVVERDTVIPRGSSQRRVEQRSTEQMAESQVNAAAAALTLLGHEVRATNSGARIESFSSDAPAASLLREGDVIVSADDLPVLRTDDLVRIVRTHEVGDVVTLGVLRGEETVTVPAETMGRPENPSEPMLGVVLEDVSRIDLPFPVDIDSGGIGGPSAGLMYALGIVDLLDDRDLAGGRIVAGTGEISAEGVVGLVGGLRQKVRAARGGGADLFLVPAGGLNEACSVSGGLQVIGVNDLEEAVRALLDPSFALGRAC